MTDGIDVDDLGRPLIPESSKVKITETFAFLDETRNDKGEPARAALLVVTDLSGTTRAMLAAKLGGGWKVAAGGGYVWKEKKPIGFVAVQWAI